MTSKRKAIRARVLRPAESPQTAVTGDETPDSLVRDESESAQDEDTALPVFTLDPEPSQGESQNQTHISTQENSDSQSSNQQRNYLPNTTVR